MMTLTLPLSPPHSVGLGTKVRAQSSIRGCLQCVERYRAHGLWIQVDEAPRIWGLGAPSAYASTLSHLPFWIRTPRSWGL